VIDEVNAMSASELRLLDETMCKVFDCNRKKKDENGKLMPFGGKTMVFLGDAAQLRPVCGTAIYDNPVEGTDTSNERQYASVYKHRTARGLVLYREYLSMNCNWLTKGFRNTGLLSEIMDRVRNGKQTFQM